MSLSRAIAAINLPGVEPSEVVTGVPEFRWVDPASLLVDEVYQRNLSRGSMELIRKIVAGWDWTRFKPPVVADTADGMEVIDGQHTAIAAATHPAIGQIPVMLVAAPEMADRARAFVGHNRDRLTLSQVSIHYANVAAGDEDALTVQQVCERAGVRLLRFPPGNGDFKAGESLAIAAIRALVNRRGAMRARIVLQVLADAHCAPVRASGIKAVETLLHDQEYKGLVEAQDITSALMRLGSETAEREASVFSAAHNVPVWRGLTVVLFREAKRGRRRAA
jgi:hypothetical protein